LGEAASVGADPAGTPAVPGPEAAAAPPAGTDPGAAPPSVGSPPAVEADPAEGERNPRRLLELAREAADQGDHQRAYSLADRSYQRRRSNEAVQIMTVAACKLEDGVKARAAFRKLVGGSVRAEVAEACQAVGVELQAQAEGATAAELYARAKLAADAGDWKTAFDLAKQSSRKDRNVNALRLLAISACKLKNEKWANRIAKMLIPDMRKQVVAQCAADGVEIQP
jgi:hypothetical protein